MQDGRHNDGRAGPALPLSGVREQARVRVQNKAARDWSYCRHVKGDIVRPMKPSATLLAAVV